MPSSGLSVDISRIIQESKGFRDLATQMQTRVTARAVSTLRRRIGPEANRELAEDLNLPARQISQRTHVTGGQDFVEVTGSGHAIPLSLFSAKWGGRSTPGATAQVFRSGDRRTYVSTFIAKGVVYTRAKKGTKRVGRLPIRQLFGPDIGSILISSHGGPSGQIAGRLAAFARDILAAEVERLIAVEVQSI